VPWSFFDVQSHIFVTAQPVVAEIKARDRTVLSYLTQPITRTLSQGMGER
jgi:hypothetical protein